MPPIYTPLLLLYKKNTHTPLQLEACTNKEKSN